MDEAAITQYLTDTFDGVDVVVNASGIPSFSTIPRAAFRLNIGIGKPTYHALFGAQPSPSDADSDGKSDYDFTALDQVLPHPVYGRMYWVCVLNPSEATFQTVVRPLLAEAYDLAVGKGARRVARR